MPDTLEKNKGAESKIALILAGKQLSKKEDFLFFFPRHYQDRRTIQKISSAQAGSYFLISGEIIAAGIFFTALRRLFEVTVYDGSGYLSCIWFNFNQYYMQNAFKRGKKVLLYGRVELFGGKKSIYHPEIDFSPFLDAEETGIVSVYPEIKGIYPKKLRRIVLGAVKSALPYVSSPLPEHIAAKKGFPSAAGCFKEIHNPSNNLDIEKLNSFSTIYHRRLIFEEFFYFQLLLAAKKKMIKKTEGILISQSRKLWNNLAPMLPYKFTDAQKNALREIKDGFEGGFVMHRLLQGDVGSGKTIVAFASALLCIESKYQVALMVPTEILARQHYLNFKPYCDKIGVSSALLTGSIARKEKEQIRNRIAEGNTDMVIGTHALIQEDVEFKSLGYIIVDEQHRFGVLQRLELMKKGVNPHLLVMTATPIPRTLALTLYGDFDISVINRLPEGRIPVKTKTSGETERMAVYRFLKQEVEKGGQGYVIFPLIEESEKSDLKSATAAKKELENVFPSLKFGLIHGKMKPKEKERVMDCYVNKEIDVLVSTTVVEVGVDVPDATVMIIEHAERFGLSTLHQLRGRVGRSTKQSYCFLINYTDNAGDSSKRLKIMEISNDGFKIAEEDLKLRGPGDLLGVRQAGLPLFRVGDIVRDTSILSDARKEALELIEKDPLFEKEENARLKDYIERVYNSKLNFG